MGRGVAKPSFNNNPLFGPGSSPKSLLLESWLIRHDGRVNNACLCDFSGASVEIMCVHVLVNC